MATKIEASGEEHSIPPRTIPRLGLHRNPPHEPAFHRILRPTNQDS